MSNVWEQQHTHRNTSVNILESIIVRPAEETPKEILWLPKLDMMLRSPKSHTTLFFIYEPTIATRKRLEANRLKDALSKILVPFYPLAGSLRINENKDRYEIDCNAKGVLFVRAETGKRLADFGDFRPSAELRKVTIPACDYSELSVVPLVMMQITGFKCGGVSFGFAIHHHVTDGVSLGLFVYSFLRIVHGLPLIVSPVHQRRIHIAPRHPPRVTFPHSDDFAQILPSSLPHGLLSEESEKMQSRFEFSEEQVKALKEQVTSEMESKTKRPTTYEVFAAHVWRSACNARSLLYDQEVKLYIPVNGRTKLRNPPLPEGYFGNVLFFAICCMSAGDVIHKPLWYVVSKIQEAVRKLDDAYMRSGIHHLELQKGLPATIIGPQNTIFPNLMINSWARVPVRGIDIGLGQPKVFGNCEINLEGLSFLAPTPSGDEGLSLAINLFALHTPLFQKHLYDFGTLKCNL